MINPKPYSMSVHISGAQHDCVNPHRVLREGGSNLCVLEYVRVGRVRLNVGGQGHELGRGDAFLFKPGVRQDYGMVKSFDHHWACFTPRPHWDEWLDWPELAPGLLHLHVGDEGLHQMLDDLFFEGRELSIQPWPQRNDFVLNQVERILLRLATINPLSRHALLDGRIRSALRFIADHHGASLSLEVIAAHCSMSQSRLSHLFSAEVGCPPMQYVNRYRIERAQSLLQSTSHPIGIIAHQVGFTNPLYFSRLFTQQVGTPPGRFRRQYQRPGIS